MLTIEIPWLNEEFVPVVDPDDLKALWNLCEDIEKRKALHGGTNDITVLCGPDIPFVGYDFFQKGLKPGADFHSVNYRGTVLRFTLPELPNGVSDAVFQSLRRGPMKVMDPYVRDTSRFKMEDLVQLIDKEKGPFGPLG
jgi:hypothetical protein